MRVGQPRMALVLSVFPDEPAHPWSPGTSALTVHLHMLSSDLVTAAQTLRAP